MNKELFVKIVVGVREYDDYLLYKKDYTELPRSTCVHKCFAAFRCIAYGAPPDTVNDYLRMAESTTQATVYKFC
jgi:hypothetical protein